MFIKNFASSLSGKTRGKVLLTVCAAVTLLCLLTSFVVMRLNFVTVVTDGEKVASFTTVQSEQDALLETAGIKLGVDDKIKMTTSGQNITLEIDRAFPVTIKADEHIITVMVTEGTTVGAALQKAGVSYSEKDKLSAKATAVVSADMEITLTRRATKTVTETQVIDFDKKTEKTDKLYKGQTQVKQKGVKGEKTLTYSVVYENGEMVSRTLIDSAVTKEAQDEIILEGTKTNVVTSINTNTKVDLTGARRLTFTATAYCGTSDGGQVTAMGKPACYGTVAVDPKVIPLGTKLYICSPDGSYVYGYCVAGDTGGAIKGNRVDLFLGSESECRAFGRRTMYVYILD